MQHVFGQAGFIGEFTKPDPRGIEYGRFIAKRTPENFIEVTYDPLNLDDDTRGYKYVMVFTSELSFKNWAMQCT